MKSIQSKFLAVVIAGLLVITAVVSIIAVTMTHELLHKDADRILNNMAQREAAYLNDVFGDVTNTAAFMETYTLSEIQSVDQLHDSDFQEAYIGKTKTMFETVVHETDNIAAFYLRFNPEYTAPTTGYYIQVTSSGKFKNIAVTDLSQFQKNDMVHAEWYYRPLQEGQAVWLQPYYPPNEDKLLITYSVPLYVDGEFLGVLGVDIDFTVFQNRISNISVYDNGYALLTSNDGTVRYTHENRPESGNPHTKATAPLLNGMLLELRADYNDIQKESRPMLTNIVLAFLVVLVVAVGFTIFMTGRLVKPLKLLTSAAEDFASGNTENIQLVAAGATDEIGILSKVLFSAYEKIQEYTSYINTLAYTDSLTGMKNSTAYTEATAQINQDIHSESPKFGVLVADINNLKQTNDKYGHDVGNCLIVETAKVLTSVFQDSPVFRIGGDEFAVILSGNDYDNFEEALRTLDEACAKTRLSAECCNVPVSLARGVAIFDPAVDNIYEDVFTKADQAMYAHKEACKASL